MAVIESSDVVDAVQTQLETGTVAVYRSEGPKPPAPPTVILHPSPGGYEGSLGNPDSDLILKFQTTCIGETSEQAQRVHDLTVVLLLRVALTVATGVVTFPMWQVPGSQQPVMKDDDLAEPLFYVTCQWVAHAIPTT